MSDRTATPATDDASTPAWAATAGPWKAFARGVAGAFCTAGYVLVAGSVGFGAVVRDLGLGLDFAILSSFVFYALPAQVILAAEMGRDASILAAAFAVTLTSIRLLPMTVNLSPMLRDRHGRRWLEVLSVHFVAVTAWLEGHRRLPHLPAHLRLPHFLGLGTMFMLFTATGAAIGFAIAGSVPAALTAALLFFTPSYFMLTMLVTARQPPEKLSILLGAVLGPIVYRVSPDLDLAVAGILGGTAAYLLGEAPVSYLGDGTLGWLAMLVFAALVHEPWRWAGYTLGRSLDMDGEVFKWVRLVSTALVAALVSRLVLFPSGALGTVPVWMRVVAFAVALTVFYRTRMTPWIGVCAGAALIGIGKLALG